MKCSIKLFAGIRETIGAQDVSLEIYPGMTALECREMLAQSYPLAADLIRTSRLAVSNAFVLDEHPLFADSSIELALIPPVSGG
jgi:molybdopterin synthase catalytic subunit